MLSAEIVLLSGRVCVLVEKATLKGDGHDIRHVSRTLSSFSLPHATASPEIGPGLITQMSISSF